MTEMNKFPDSDFEWPYGTRVRKISGGSWHGLVVGSYKTELTPVGYAVESEREPGSVQIYPRAALELNEAADEIEKLQKRVKELEYEIELMWQDAAGASL